MKVRIVRYEDGDWMELWRDGVLVYENHDIDLERGLTLLGIEYEWYEADLTGAYIDTSTEDEE